MADIIAQLTASSLQPSSIPTYKRAWKLFTEFHNTLFHAARFTLPILPATLALFIAYLFERNYAPSTVNSYVSALGYSHKLSGQPDPTRTFFIVQMLKGYGKTGSRLDSRLPITLPILEVLLEVSPQITGSLYQTCQFKAMCTLAFFAFLRVGEITATSDESRKPLQIDQLAYIYSMNNQVSGIQLTFANYKHHYNERPFTLTIHRQNSCCPIQALVEYRALRGTRAGALFMGQDGKAVSRDTFSNQLAEAVSRCGLDPTRYKGHSFRIGAASYAAARGVSDAQIRTMGRWKSNAFHKYIRVSSMTT